MAFARLLIKKRKKKTHKLIKYISLDPVAFVIYLCVRLNLLNLSLHQIEDVLADFIG